MHPTGANMSVYPTSPLVTFNIVKDTPSRLMGCIKIVKGNKPSEEPKLVKILPFTSVDTQKGHVSIY